MNCPCTAADDDIFSVEKEKEDEFNDEFNE